MSDDRVRVPDPALMQRAGTRMLLALIIVLILVTPLTVGGITLLVAGEAAGLPLAAGGVVLGVAAIVLTVTTRRIRRTLDQGTVARGALEAARRVSRRVRLACLTTLLALIVFGVVRGLSGEWWSLGTALLMGVALYVFGNGANTMVKAHDRALAA
ncbi:hypothetical protein HH310_02450 [Actinoplanes sp. TBRC 11911]|uniref:hypothetical protein n=1 Tax=Actinoplanes sp. TBRC 11911 TaxID=2729386 RepID=UPI00145E80FB|nr:hypothetical protein [Actinoplanes sp. TBRC 11911]NMO50057.1 hypothetical protein [Actinoplanes sp. TBRC 11911]